VPHDGDGGQRLSGQPEIDGDRVPDMDVTFNDGSQTAFPKIEADASYRPHPPRDLSGAP